MELRDGELLLRPPGPADIDAVASACSDEAMARFIPLIPVPYERSHAESWIDRLPAGLGRERCVPFRHHGGCDRRASRRNRGPAERRVDRILGRACRPRAWSCHASTAPRLRVANGAATLAHDAPR